MNHDIFLSYSNKQQKIADGVCRYLEENGFKCWMAPRDIPVGSDYGDLIEEAIKQSKVVVLVFSEDASVSKWVKGEINVAFNEDKPIFPFRVDETEIKGTFRVMLNQMHWINAYPHYTAKLPDLLSSIRVTLNRQSSPVVDIHDAHYKSVKKKFPIWAAFLFLGVLLGSLFFVTDYGKGILGKMHLIKTYSYEETQLRTIIQDLCTAIEKNELDGVGDYYADHVKRYHSIYDVTNEEVERRYKAYDEKFGVKKKNYAIRWNTFQIWENADKGWTVVVVVDYHIDREKSHNFTTFVIEKHLEFDKDFKIVSEYDEQLSKSKY